MAIWNRTEQILKNQTSSRRGVYGSWGKKKPNVGQNSLIVAGKLTVQKLSQ